MRHILLANLSMIAEIPAPTFQETGRVEFLINRFCELGLQNASSDEMGNALGVLPGQEAERNILLVAHVDNVFDETEDHAVTLQKDTINGIGLADNALGLAALATLPTLLEALGIRLRSHLVFLGDSQSLGRGNLQGMRFFLKNSTMAFSQAIVLEGVPLGCLSYHSVGMIRGEIRCLLPDEYDWSQFGVIGAIQTLNEVICRMAEIRIPKRPRTSIVFGSIEGGESFSDIATQASLRFEIRSESAGIVSEIRQEISDIIAEVSSKMGEEIVFEIVARRRPGGIPFQHPLVQTARNVMKGLGIPPRISPSLSELSACKAHGIPTIVIGLTEGEHINRRDEMLQIPPIFKGLAQWLGILQAIDQED
ncbi:MAG: M20/M25/M40 family metallo-hydrolase [Planctomycetota bacterium]